MARSSTNLIRLVGSIANANGIAQGPNPQSQFHLLLRMMLLATAQAKVRFFSDPRLAKLRGSAGFLCSAFCNERPSFAAIIACIKPTVARQPSPLFLLPLGTPGWECEKARSDARARISALTLATKNERSPIETQLSYAKTFNESSSGQFWLSMPETLILELWGTGAQTYIFGDRKIDFRAVRSQGRKHIFRP